jgi:hypothetical protein
MAEVMQYDFMPLKLDRATEPALLAPESARVLEWVDVAWFRGRVRRMPGEVGTQITPAAVNVTNAFVATRRDCRKCVLDTTNGTVRCSVGDNGTLLCLGPTNEWGDTDDFVTAARLAETDDEDGGVDAAGGCG